MEPDARTIRRLAQETLFQAPRLEKVIRLTDFIAEIARHHVLGDRLRLKGGTALNVYHLDLPRLSVDADFNFQSHVEARDLPAAKRDVEKALGDIAKAFGYALERYQDSHALRAYILRYKSTLGNLDHIKLDINYVERVPVLAPVAMRPPDWLPVPDTPIPVLALDELAGSKLATLMLRSASRDLFDVAQLAALEIDWAVAGRIAVFHGFLDDLALTSLRADRMDGIKPADFRSNLQDLLPKRSTFASMKSDEALRVLRATARPLADAVMSVPGIAQCRSLLAKGVWEPKSLFEAPVNDLAQHPGMAWRLQAKQ